MILDTVILTVVIALAVKLVRDGRRHLAINRAIDRFIIGGK